MLRNRFADMRKIDTNDAPAFETLSHKGAVTDWLSNANVGREER